MDKRKKHITLAIANAGLLLKNEGITTNKVYGTRTSKRFRNPALAIAMAVMHNGAGQSSGHRALAHLLAALSIATPKQAKQPTFSED